MSTNGQLVFTDVDKITFKGVGNTSNAVVDTVTGKIGVGIDNPDANLHVLGNSYVSTNLELGGTLIMGTVNVEAYHSLEAVTATGNTTPLTVEFSNATTGIVTTGNVEVGNDLIVSGNVEVGLPKQYQKLVASDGATGDYFGSSVSIDGDTMVIGAYADDDNGYTSGSAYVFTRTNGIWTQRAKLTANDAVANDYFGMSVSISGDTVVIGAYADDDDGSASGSAYVFTRNTAGDLASGWAEVAKLTAGDADAIDQFGRSVSIDGDTVVIGAFGDDSYTGSAYVFTRDTAGDLTSGWTQRAKLTASDGAGGDRFGYNVDISGDTVVIGAYYDDDKGSNSGSAYVFTRNTAGDLASNWTQVAKLIAGDGAVNDYFGFRVSIDGDTVVIGAFGASIYRGSAYVFTRDTAGDLTSGWTQRAKLTASDAATYDYFGFSVSINGDTMVIGAYGDGSTSGSAYVFMRNTAGDLTSGWTQRAKLTANDGAAGDNFGSSVSIDSDTIVIGARYDGSYSGSVYTFSTLVIKDITVTGNATVARELTVTGSATMSGNVEVGKELTVAGNTTVSSNLTVSGNVEVGKELTVTGNMKVGLSPTQYQKLVASDGAADDYFGSVVSIDGDTMVIGADTGDNGTSSGSAYVFTRTNGIWTQVTKLTASDAAAYDYFGISVSIDGDTMVIGARADDDNNATNSGSAYVFTRNTAGDLTSGWTQLAKLTASDAAADDFFGQSVSIDGDTVVIGAYLDDDVNGSSNGSAYVFTRNTAGDLTSGWTQRAKLTASDAAADDYFGSIVSIDGDTAVIGAWADDHNNGTNSGSAYVFTRDTAGDLTSGWTQRAKLTASDAAADDYFGKSVSIDGDTVVIGADGDGSSSGSAYVFTRSTAGDLTSGWTQRAKLTANDGAASDHFGYSVSIDGDTVVIGAYRDDDNGIDSGSAYVFTRVTSGDLTSGWTQVAKLTADDGTASDYLGYSVSIDGDTTVIGAKYGDGNVTDSGSVYTFSTPVIKDITVTGNATVAKELTVAGNTTVSSNLTVTGNVEVAKELTVAGNATVSSNLTVTGNVEVAKELTVAGNATVSSNLTVNGHIHQEDGRWKFDFENRRPARLTPTTEFRYVVVQGTTDLPSSSQPDTKYVIPDSGTTVYQYTPSTDTTTTLVSSTSSADTVGSIALTTGTEIFTTGAKPFVLSTPAYNHAVIPFTCKGYYFGFTNNRMVPTTIFMYAPYEDVTVNLYLDKAITETPTETFTLTKQTVVTRTINPSVDDYSYTIEAVNGVIVASRKGQDTLGASDPDGDHEILYPASDLGYNMTSSNANYYNHDIFNTGGSAEGKWRFSSGIIQTGPTFYSPAGIPHFSSCAGDGDGGDTTGIIPHEIVGEIYYIPHIIPGYMIGFLTNRQTITAQYYYGGQWYTENATTGPQYGVSAYNCIPVRRWTVGSKLDGGRSDLSGNMLTSTLWKFTSDHPFVLRVENDDQATQGLDSSGTNGWDEYMAIGWLNSTRTTPIYKPPCLLTPVMYQADLVADISVNAGIQDVWTEYNVFDEQNSKFNRVYGGGFSTYGTGTRIIVPAPGFYRCTATVYLYRIDGVNERTSTEISFSAYNGARVGSIGEGYIREYDDHDHTSISITSIVDLTNADWNSTSTDVLPHIGLLFRRGGTSTQVVKTQGVSNVILELIR